MLIVKCNNCDAQFRCESDSAGEQVQCPQCGARLRVPFDAPDLDAIKQRSETKTEPAPPVEQPEDQDEVTEDAPQVLTATTHDLYTQQKRQHATVTISLETLHQDLTLLGRRLRTVSVQLHAVIVLLIATCLCIVLFAISILMRR